MAGTSKKACEECVRAGHQLTHDSKKDNPKMTHFFRIILGPEFYKSLVLPPKFAETVKDLADQETKVKDGSGTCWTITLSCRENLLAFQKGWSEFSNDKGLQMGDFLVFKRVKGSSHFAVQVFGRDGCEKLNSATRHLPVKRATTAGKSTPSETTREDAKRKKRRTSVRFQQGETSRVPSSDCGKKKQICNDLPIFEMQQDTSNVVENNKDSGPKCDVPFEHDQAPLDGLPNDLPSAVAPEIPNVPNVVIPLQSPNMMRGGTSPQNPPSPNRNLNEEFDNVERDGVEVTEQASPCGPKGVPEPSTRKERGRSSAAKIPDIIKVKTEKVDEPSDEDSLETSVTCLAETNGSFYIDLQEHRLPSVSVRRGRKRVTVILEDPEGREWGGLYHERSGIHILVAPWLNINEANAIQPGDRLTFTIIDESLNKFKFEIVRDQPAN